MHISDIKYLDRIRENYIDSVMHEVLALKGDDYASAEQWGNEVVGQINYVMADLRDVSLKFRDIQSMFEVLQKDIAQKGGTLQDGMNMLAELIGEQFPSDKPMRMEEFSEAIVAEDAGVYAKRHLDKFRDNAADSVKRELMRDPRPVIDSIEWWGAGVSDKLGKVMEDLKEVSANLRDIKVVFEAQQQGLLAEGRTLMDSLEMLGELVNEAFYPKPEPRKKVIEVKPEAEVAATLPEDRGQHQVPAAPQGGVPKAGRRVVPQDPGRVT